MEVKLYVGNLSYDTTEEEIRNLFAQAGTVTEVALIKDRDTGSSKGFAFVTMTNQADADKAIGMYNAYSLSNNELKVNIAKPRVEFQHSGSLLGQHDSGVQDAAVLRGHRPSRPHPGLRCHHRRKLMIEPAVGGAEIAEGVPGGRMLAALEVDPPETRVLGHRADIRRDRRQRGGRRRLGKLGHGPGR